MWSIVANNDTTKTAPIALHFRPGNSNIKVLDLVADMFDNWTLHALAVTYRPACAATQSGVLGLGIDWEVKDPTVAAQTTLSLKPIAALDPHSLGACWQPVSFRIPVERAQRMRVMKTSSTDTTAEKLESTAFHLIGQLDKGNFTAGYIEVSYDISFSGLRYLTA